MEDDQLIVTRVGEEIVKIEHKNGYDVDFEIADKKNLRESIHKYVDNNRNYLWQAFENMGHVLYLTIQFGNLQEISTTDSLIYALNNPKVYDIYTVTVYSNLE